MKFLFILLTCSALVFSAPSLEEIFATVNTENYEKNERLIDDYIKLHPEEARAYFVKTLILISGKRYKEAKNYIIKAVALQSNEWEYCRTLAQIHEELEESDLAIKAWRKCLELGETKPQTDEAKQHIIHLETE